MKRQPSNHAQILNIAGQPPTINIALLSVVTGTSPLKPSWKLALHCVPYHIEVYAPCQSPFLSDFFFLVLPFAHYDNNHVDFLYHLHLVINVKLTWMSIFPRFIQPSLRSSSERKPVIREELSTLHTADNLKPLINNSH